MGKGLALRAAIFIAFLSGSHEQAYAFNCKGLVYRIISQATSAFPTRGTLTFAVQKLLDKNRLAIIDWKENIAVLRGNLGVARAGSPSVYLSIRQSKARGRLSIHQVITPRGLLVYVLNKKSREIVFVGVPEGSEESDRNMIKLARRVLRRGLVAVPRAA